MTTSVQHRWFLEHRRWEVYVSAGLGLLVILSPALPGAEVSTAIHLSTGLCGVVVVMVALLETMSLRRWEEIIELASAPGWSCRHSSSATAARCACRISCSAA